MQIHIMEQTTDADLKEIRNIKAQISVAWSEEERQGRSSCPSWIFDSRKIAEKSFCREGKFSSRNAKFGADINQFCGKFRGKIKILSFRNLFCRKIATFCPAYIFIHHAVERKSAPNFEFLLSISCYGQRCHYHSMQYEITVQVQRYNK